MKAVSHVNIERMLDYFEDVSKIYLCLEYHNGGPLKDYLKLIDKEEKEIRVRDIATKIANALEHLHSHGVILRNLDIDSIQMSSLSPYAAPRITNLDQAIILKNDDKTYKELDN